MPEATLEAVPSARVAPVGGVAREVVRLVAGRLERSVPGDERADAAGRKRTADAGASRGG
jgi:hypothetical protein